LSGWPRRPHGFAIAVGAGWIVGALLCGLFMRSLAADDLSTGLFRIGTCATVLGATGWLVGWYLRGHVPLAALPRATRAEAVATALLLAVLAARAWLFASDIALHPTLPWDAWAVWSAKAKAWVMTGHAAPYVSFDTWLSQPDADVRTAAAWNYPELLPWTLTWFATYVGWVEPWVNAAWLGLWAGLLLAHYGQWRDLGLSRLHALAGVYLLGSLPLLDAHVALGGYADLWVGALMSLATHAWLGWRETHERRQLAIVALLAALLPMIKLEGAIWSIVLAAATLFGVLPRGLRTKRFFIGAVAAALILALSITLSMPWVAVARRYVQDSAAVDLRQAGQSLRAVANALWGQWNWNMLWFVLPAASIWMRAQWRNSSAVRRLVAFVAVPVLLVVGLFVFTSAARYAQSYSAVNRLLLQLAPMLVSVLVFVLWPPADQPVERASPDEAAAA
jgi:hypothetical protein